MTDIVNLLCCLTPKSGKFDRVKALLADLAKTVTVEHPDCFRYVVWEQVDAANNNNDRRNLFILEQWESQAALDAHQAKGFIKDLTRTFEEEDLLAEPEVDSQVRFVEGFFGR
ncbi:MAG: hypothetical protein M1816_004692 [Peltula sp. TS41687]|nr:MAG: hypothetical protein M1816_004692 [Peltula sp. TS41687]